MGAMARESKLQEDAGPSLQRIEPLPLKSDLLRTADADSVVRNFSIVVGGPVYDFLKRSGLVQVALPNVLRRIGALVVITWLPLLVLSLKDDLAFGHNVTIPLLYDFSTYSRLLLALPLLLLAEVVIDPAILAAIAEFVDAGLVQENEFPEFERVLQRVRAVRDSPIPELVLLGLAFFPTFLFQHEWAPGTVSSWHTTARGLTTSGWWYIVISAPMLRFFIYRWLFRYFIWGLLLWKLGKLDLHLIPTHPDRAAGLGFLNLTQAFFGILFCALGFAFTGPIVNAIVYERAPLASFQFLMMGFLALSLILGLLPLTLLFPKLARIRMIGLWKYGKLATQYTEAFERKWVRATEQPSEPLLGTSDIQSLADLGNSYALVRDMSFMPITKMLVIQLAAQASLPLIPVVLIGTPAGELVHAILKMVI